MKNPLFCLFALFCALNWSRADEWPQPIARFFSSDDGTRTLKIVPIQGGERFGKAKATWKEIDAGGREGEGASFDLVNVPLRVLIPGNQKSYFVTLDTHGSAGYKHTLVIYKDQKMAHELELEDFLTPEQIRKHVVRSIVSRWWREGATFTFYTPTRRSIDETGMAFFEPNPEKTQLHIIFPWDRRIAIELETGKVVPYELVID